MSKVDLGSTQPSKPSDQDSPPKSPVEIKSPKPKKQKLWLWALIFFALISISIIIGALAGYRSALTAQKNRAIIQAGSSLEEQFELGIQDLEAGRYEVALQRFEFIAVQDPGFPGLTDKLADAMAVVYSTATPAQSMLESTPTPTRDPRPIEELFDQVLSQIVSQDWEGAIQTALALRKEDPNYQTARVDGILFLSLRQRGVAKILGGGNLEGGIYDLALTEVFGPLDVEANQAREWARLYVIGLSFWEVHPEQAVFYFSQVAAAAPYLTDASGWRAVDRYRAALIQYGDLLASQDAWCQAKEQYDLAQSIRPDASLQITLDEVIQKCLITTITPTVSETPTPDLTGTAMPTTSATATPTATLDAPSETHTPTTVITPPIETPTPTATSTPVAPTATFTQLAPTATNTIQSYPPPASDSPQTSVLPGSSEVNSLLRLTSRYSIVTIWQGLTGLIKTIL